MNQRHPDTLALSLSFLLSMLVLVTALASNTERAPLPILQPGVVPVMERYAPFDPLASIQSSPWTDPTNAFPSSALGDPADENWWHLFAPQRIGNTILAAIVFEGDLVVGGDFTDASGLSAFHVARWTGSSWQPMGSGFDESVYDFAVHNGELIAAGAFTQSGMQEVQHIARWDGSAWQPLGPGLNDAVLAVAEVQGQLYAGGSFTRSGESETELNRVAEWDGSAWNPLGGGVRGVRPRINKIGEWNGELIIGGAFTELDTGGASNLARWDGTNWANFAGGVNGTVYDFAPFGQSLVVAGSFSSAGGTSAQSIANYDGTAWSAVDIGMNDTVLSLVENDGELYAGGLFSTAGDTTATSVARLEQNEGEPEQWVSVDTQMDGGVTRLVSLGGRVIAGGVFISAGGNTTNFIAQYDGMGWGSLGSEINGSVRALLANASCENCDLVAAGDFTVAGGRIVSRIAKWTRGGDPSGGFRWEPLGEGFNGTVRTLIDYGGELYAGGSFTFVDTLTAGGIARWDGESWQPLGNGLVGSVWATTIWNDQLVVAGDLQEIEGTPIDSQVAAWNGSQFSAVGTAFSGAGFVRTATVYRDELIIGGSFQSDEFGSVPHLARNAGGIWEALGGGTNGEVRALAEYDNRLFVGGNFSQAGGADALFLTAWDGSAFSPGFGVINAAVEALEADSSFLHVGGHFSLELPEGTSKSVGLYNSRGGWFGLGSGVDTTVSAIALVEEDIYLGGEFTLAGNKASRGIARYLSGIPVPVRLAEFSGRRTEGAVEIRWRVGSAVEHAGFHLYRGDTSDDARISEQLIRGAHAETHEFLFVDETAPDTDTVYWLEEIATDGASTFFGPLQVQAADALPAFDRISAGPNPFAESTTIRFRLGQESDVRVDIHDVAGRRVATVHAQSLVEGAHELIWDGRAHSGRQTAPGVYFAAVRATRAGLSNSDAQTQHTVRLLKLR